jgi:hypothetical protein
VDRRIRHRTATDGKKPGQTPLRALRLPRKIVANLVKGLSILAAFNFYSTESLQRFGRYGCGEVAPKLQFGDFVLKKRRLATNV